MQYSFKKSNQSVTNDLLCCKICCKSIIKGWFSSSRLFLVWCCFLACSSYRMPGLSWRLSALFLILTNLETSGSVRIIKRLVESRCQIRDCQPANLTQHTWQEPVWTVKDFYGLKLFIFPVIPSIVFRMNCQIYFLLESFLALVRHCNFLWFNVRQSVHSECWSNQIFLRVLQHESFLRDPIRFFIGLRL